MRAIPGEALAGLAGIAALYAYERLETRMLGRVPLYALPSLEARIRGVSPRHAGALAALFRLTYGTGWALVYARAVPGPRPRHAATLALTIWAFELALMPPFRAAPPLRAWPRVDLVALLGHILAFAIPTTLARRALTRRAAAA